MSESNGTHRETERSDPVYITRNQLISNIHWTPTQYRMLRLLSDGQPHTGSELHACLLDDLGARTNIAAHLWAIRQKLLPLGETVECVLYKGRPAYRHIIILRADLNLSV